jgi:hypothetical protein
MAMFAGFENLNFFPSSEWTIISVILSVILGLGCAIAFVRFGNKQKKVSGFLASAIVSGVMFYNLLVYGIGAAATSSSLMITEIDIVGTKAFTHGFRSSDRYYIDTLGFPLTRVYIKKEEYKAIPQQARLHVVLKHSFFGKRVERYTFLALS